MLGSMTNACRLRRSAPALSAPAARARPVGRRRPVLLWAGVAVLSLAADAATKAWALAALRHGHRIAVAGSLLRLQLVANHGAAFGIGAGYEPVIALVSFAAVVLLMIWAHYTSSNTSRFGAALAAGGAAGNLLDRLIRPPGVLHGAVTDWIHVSFYGPTFNLADVFLRAGVLIAAAGWLWNRRSQPGRP
jgi:signal peptidase II